MPKRYEFGGVISTSVFSGEVELPDGVTPQAYAASKEGREALYAAFQDWWENSGVKFRDFEVVVDEVTEYEVDEDGAILGESSTEFPEAVQI